MRDNKINTGPATPVSDLPFQPLGRHLIEELGADVFTPVVPSGATWILVQANTENIRYTIDPGQPPTAAIGFRIVADDVERSFPLDPNPIAGSRNPVVRFLREAAGAILQYQFGKF